MRRIFWNFKTAFVGLPLAGLAPKNFLVYPVAIGIPLYTFVALQSGLGGFAYYDEYDGEVREN